VNVVTGLLYDVRLMIAARPDIDELVAIDPTDGTHER
jgi:hypothetical protein